jgi:SAM-dependent methyltransferase
MPDGRGLAAEKQVGVARAKRRSLSRAELRESHGRARAVLAEAGWAPAAVRLAPLALSDLTQTYRVRAAGSSAILKVMPSSTATASLQAHAFLSSRGISLPAVRWADAHRGAILYEDLGSAGVTTAPRREELAALVSYLARLHAAGIVGSTSAAAAIPAIAKDGWPTPAALAARLLTHLGAETPRARRSLLDMVGTLGEWIGAQPRIVVGDIKREHFRFRGRMPILTDLEIVSAWDVIPSNLATLLAFPGQFRPPIDAPLRRWLLERYVAEHDRLEGTTTDVASLDRAVRCAEGLIAITLAKVSEIDPGARDGQTHGGSGILVTRAGGMVRDRGMFAASSGLLSAEHELGPDLFALVRSRLEVAHSLRILDIGCGDGQAVAEIAHRWPVHRVWGLDRARGSWRGHRVLADVQALPVRDGTVDLAWGVQVLQYVPDKLACLAEVHRVLAPGGLAVFAMTEHFADASAFVPPLMELSRSWSPTGAIHGVAERRLAGRRVLTFAISKRTGTLTGLQPLVEARRHLVGVADAFPYVQSVYSR